MVREGDRTPYNMLIENCTVNACWKEVVAQSSYEQRLCDVATFNRSVQSCSLYVLTCYRYVVLKTV